jgi:hypothetical protein
MERVAFIFERLRPIKNGEKRNSLTYTKLEFWDYIIDSFRDFSPPPTFETCAFAKKSRGRSCEQGQALRQMKGWERKLCLSFRRDQASQVLGRTGDAVYLWK